MEHKINRKVTLNRWNRDYPPRLVIKSGDTVTAEMRDASDGQVRPDMSSDSFSKLDFTRIHALTGPIAVDNAEPGDRLIIEILDYRHEGWAWTSIIPGMGLLPDDFKKHHLHIWKLENNQTRSLPGVTLPLAPFCGIIGVQREEAGEFRTRAPGPFGGNMDVRHLTTGSTLHLPVMTQGAGLCVGDAHAAQGDGEVSINGMEAPMTVRLRIHLKKRAALSAPYLLTPPKLEPPALEASSYHVFIESDPDVREAARWVVRRAIDYLVDRLNVSREQAYILCSVVLRLKLNQLVNTPMATVGGYLPEAIFDQPANPSQLAR